MNFQQMERESLERLLAEATRLCNYYTQMLKLAQTFEQIVKLQGRLTRYEAMRVLIADLMLG